MSEILPKDQSTPSPIEIKHHSNSFIKSRSFALIIIFITIISLATIFLISIKSMELKTAQDTEKISSYNKIIQEQEKRSLTRTPSPHPEFTKKAIGSYTLHIVYTKPVTLSASVVTGIMNALNYSGESVRNKCAGSNCYQLVSLNYIDKFLTQEMKNYDINNFRVDIQTHPLISIDNLNKVGDLAVFWDKDMFGVVKLKDEFDKILDQNNIKIKDNDLVAFLYFDNSFDSTTESTDRFYEHKKFRSFAEQSSGKTYLNVYNLDESFSETTVEILTHELLHLFGASDKYEEYDKSRKCSLRGLGNPDRLPLFPQDQADIMCMYIEKSSNNFTRGQLIKNEFNINKYTAKEIGWIVED